MKTKSIILFILLCCSICIKLSASVCVDGIYYNLNTTDKTASVTYDDNKYSGNVVIPETIAYDGTTYSVSSIGISAFRGCVELTSVTIPNVVTSIGEYAFSGCAELTSVTIPNSVTTIERHAFSGCAGLTSMNISNSVATIPDYAFSGCTGLTSVTIPNSVTTIGISAFNGCVELTSVTIPCSVTSIGFHAFNDCVELTSVTIPCSVTSIESSAFEGCTGLTSVAFNAENCTEMGSLRSPVFSGCTKLATLTIGEKVTAIPDYAFNDWSGLTSVTIPNSVTSIGAYAFYNCEQLSSLIIGTGVLSIGSKAIGYGSTYGYEYKVAKVIWLPNTPPKGYNGVLSKMCYVANDQYEFGIKYQYLSSMFEVDGIRYVPVSPSERTCHAIDCTYAPEDTEITIKNVVSHKGISMTITDINPYTCYNNTHIAKVIVNYDGNIGAWAFDGCTSITNVDITAKYIDDYAFLGCSSITNADITTWIIGNYAFKDCSKLAKVTLGESLTSIGSYAFSGCSSLDGVTIPNSVKSIGSYAFNNCSSLAYAKIGDGLKTIQKNSFNGCSSLSSISIPKNVTKIEDYVFRFCRSLADVYIEDREDELSLGSNGSSPLFSNSPLKTVYIGGNIAYPTSSDKGYSPFYRNTSLEKVTITDKETEISENEFYGCTGLKSITMGDGIEKIGDWAFSGCSSLDYFHVGSGVKTIGKEAFSDCTAMTKLITTAAVPPTCGTQALDDINKWTCELFVPKESIDTYKAADQWKEFFFISEYGGVENVCVDEGDGVYDVYNLQGIVVKRGLRETEIGEALPHGVYILVLPQNRKKIVI